MTTPDRDALASRYLEQLPYAPYPVQEEALLSWFTAEQGVMVCTPTGTGKTLIAQAALFEALHTGQRAYYTTPLIALTEQKFLETQALAKRWGFSPDQVGLVTGNRRVNPEANVLIVVAEILLNRLLNSQEFDFSAVSAVVMDEFHSFADPERGIVWELTLNLLPPHVRLLLLSATVGNASEFMSWLEHRQGRKLELVEGRERKVPLEYIWVPNLLLGEQLEAMAAGDEALRKTPALVFCFSRDECWSTAEHLKGLDLLPGPARAALALKLPKFDLTQGAGPKLKAMLGRGVGVHHAGLLPKYRRIVEGLFERKMLAVVVCTETLAAGINLPARSVVFTSLVKGPPGKQKLIEPSSVQQIAGRAGRPQFDAKGYVYALAHEDDVKIFRWKARYDSIPATARDPALLKMKKELERKKPTRRENQTYWNQAQFDKLKHALPGKLYSKGPLPWRLLAYLLKVSPEVERIRTVVRKRLLDEGRIRAGEIALDQMLKTLADGGFVTLDPPPPVVDPAQPSAHGSPRYQPVLAHPLPRLDQLLVFKSIQPLYGAFLVDLLGKASPIERLQAWESVLELPRPLLRFVRVPWPDELPPGPLEKDILDPELVNRGLLNAKVLLPPGEPDDDELVDDDEDEFPKRLAEKLFLLFEAKFPTVTDLAVEPVWCAAELLRFDGDFNKYVKARDLTKQEGLVFRHCLRLVLLLGEFLEVCPPELDILAWRAELRELADRLTATCRAVDPQSTDEAVTLAHAADVVEGEHPHALP
jgi:superfamily II DNA/RNA helicase